MNIWNGYSVGNFEQLRLIFWVQQKTLRNVYARASKGGTAISILVSLFWYGGAVLLAAGLAYILTITPPKRFADAFGPMLFMMTCIWQGFPILMGSSGAHIDIRRLLVYPIPTGQLFTLEVVLRISTAIEMGILLFGGIVGLAINRNVPIWAPLALVLFGVFNLFLSTGIKQLLSRLAERKYVRELSFIFVMALLLLPQTLLHAPEGQFSSAIWQKIQPAVALLPWSVAGKLAAGEKDFRAWITLFIWTALAYRFARTQFNKMLRLDESGESKVARATHQVAAASGRLELFYRLPGRFLSDPLAAIVEKELRFLSRAPRFRLLFLLACTIGQMLWLPQVLRVKDTDASWVSENYLTFTCLYAMLVLAENLFINTFGFDRAAAQNWFVLPVPFRTVLRAKNIVAFFFLGLCFCLTALLGMLLPVPHSFLKLAEAVGVCAVYITFMLGIGNLGSVYQPKPVDPQQSWRSNSPGKVQALMLLVYPVMYLPVMLAYTARWASDENWIFFAVLGVDMLIAYGFYYVATDSAVEMAARRKEEMISTLTAQSGPISITG